MLCSAAFCGGERVLLDLNFDDQIAGQSPKAWKCAWGTQDDDQLTVTSTRWVSNGNCMMLDRLTGANTKMWGMSTSFESGSSGFTFINFNILIEGPANMAVFSIGLRGNHVKNDHLFLIRFKNLNGLLGPRKGGIKFRYETGRWYHVLLEIPNSPKDGKNINFQWYPVGEKDKVVKGSVAHKFPKQSLGIMMLNTAPDKRGYQVFIDDLKIATTSELNKTPKKAAAKKS